MVGYANAWGIIYPFCKNWRSPQHSNVFDYGNGEGLAWLCFGWVVVRIKMRIICV